jgi:thiamine pyrophosphate-dependent acetolactate synthase large subunit-like protein
MFGSLTRLAARGGIVRPIDVARAVVESCPQALCVASLGTAVSALRAASDDGPHYYYGAAMGSALAGALGVAEAEPRRLVVALLGDGEMLMGTGTLWSLAAYPAPNLLVVILADGAYSITGGQPLAGQTRFAEVAALLGDVQGARVEGYDELCRVLREVPRPAVIEAVVTESVWPGPSAFVDPARVRVGIENRVATEFVSAVEVVGS